MKTKECKEMTTKLIGNIAKKVAESAVHAAVFAYVSKKVTNFMSKKEDEDKDKVRVETVQKTDVPASTESTERI